MHHCTPLSHDGASAVTRLVHRRSRRPTGSYSALLELYVTVVSRGGSRIFIGWWPPAQGRHIFPAAGRHVPEGRQVSTHQ